MDALTKLPRQVKTVSYDLGGPKGWSTNGPTGKSIDMAKSEILRSKRSMFTACAGLDVMNQHVLRGLRPDVKVRMTGRLYRNELNDKKGRPLTGC